MNYTTSQSVPGSDKADHQGTSQNASGEAAQNPEEDELGSRSEAEEKAHVELASWFSDERARQPELIFGLVGPIGCNMGATHDALAASLVKVGYQVKTIYLTKEIDKIIPGIPDLTKKKYSDKIRIMNEIVQDTEQKDILSQIAILKIAEFREDQNINLLKLSDMQAQLQQLNGVAYIIRQLKRSQEIELLRKVYGSKFVQVSVAIDSDEQLTAVKNIISLEEPALADSDREYHARKLIKTDKEETEDAFGQRMTDTYHSGDVFVAGTATEISSQVSRFIDAFFGSNYISPTRDEFGSYLAKTASLRTLDLSRQVGSAILSRDGDVITLGCNEVPRPLGGNYWAEDKNPQRDIERRVEANKLETTRIIHDFVHALSSANIISKPADEVLSSKDFAKVVKDSMISDLTEFGRMTHAEMSAVLDAARLGISVEGATIYVTTFPCHNCAKHIVGSGIKRIVYIEPYTKSKAFDLSGDALTEDPTSQSKVTVEHFRGIAPSRYRQIFEKPKKRRNEFNAIIPWHFGSPLPMVDNAMGTHTMVEVTVLGGLPKLLAIAANGVKQREAQQK